jgi:hypothetical protein
MSNIIQAVDSDALSKIADYLTIEEVLHDLGRTKKVMHGHVCNLPWYYCAHCKDHI